MDVHSEKLIRAEEEWVAESGYMRRMKDRVFREQQRDHLFDPHVARVNRLVDELWGTSRGWMPHVAPVHGGTRARLLWVFRDPDR